MLQCNISVGNMYSQKMMLSIEPQSTNQSTRAGSDLTIWTNQLTIESYS